MSTGKGGGRQGFVRRGQRWRVQASADLDGLVIFMDSGKVKGRAVGVIMLLMEKGTMKQEETLRDLVANGIFLMPDHLIRLIRGGWLLVVVGRVPAGVQDVFQG